MSNKVWQKEIYTYKGVVVHDYYLTLPSGKKLIVGCLPHPRFSALDEYVVEHKNCPEQIVHWRAVDGGKDKAKQISEQCEKFALEDELKLSPNNESIKEDLAFLWDEPYIKPQEKIVVIAQDLVINDEPQSWWKKFLNLWI